jgi:hypothetical protein
MKNPLMMKNRMIKTVGIFQKQRKGESGIIVHDVGNGVKVRGLKYLIFCQAISAIIL